MPVLPSELDRGDGTQRDQLRGHREVHELLLVPHPLSLSREDAQAQVPSRPERIDEFEREVLVHARKRRDACLPPRIDHISSYYGRHGTAQEAPKERTDTFPESSGGGVPLRVPVRIRQLALGRLVGPATLIGIACFGSDRWRRK